MLALSIGRPSGAVGGGFGFTVTPSVNHSRPGEYGMGVWSTAQYDIGLGPLPQQPARGPWTPELASSRYQPASCLIKASRRDSGISGSANFPKGQNQRVAGVGRMAIGRIVAQTVQAVQEGIDPDSARTAAKDELREGFGIIGHVEDR